MLTIIPMSIFRPIPVELNEVAIQYMVSVLISMNIFGLLSSAYIFLKLKREGRKFNLYNAIDSCFCASIPIGVALSSDALAMMFWLSYIIYTNLF